MEQKLHLSSYIRLAKKPLPKFKGIQESFRTIQKQFANAGESECNAEKLAKL